jgi:uncharacterized protein (TIGR03083 family)
VARKEELREKVIAARQRLNDTIQALADDDWDRATTNPEWSARDILSHLAVAEPGLLARMNLILEGKSQLPPGFDLNVYNTRQVAKKKGAAVAELVNSLTASREKLLLFLDELPDASLDIRGWHASGREVTVAEMLQILAWHEESHAADILTAIVSAR